MRKIVLLFSLVLLTGFQLSAQNQRVSGTVTGPDGSPVAGATVVVSGTNTVSITIPDGSYSIDAPADASLEFSFIGMVSQTVPVQSRTAINVQLENDATSIDDVVVIGYGTMKRANLTSAIATADGEVLENRPITTIGEGLQGVIPNLQITPSGTAPGQGASFNIRGYTSLNGGSPLVLVDGVVQDANLVNPNDIASISVLKDAASSAIYGSRAAYGVILLTTKSGKRNQAPTFNVSTSWSTSQPIHLQHSISALDYVSIMNESSHNDGAGDIFGERQVDFIKKYDEDPVNNLPVYYDPISEKDGKYGYSGNTDWADVLYRNGGQQQYNISMSGGSENTQYYVSYGLLNQQGVLSAYDDNYQRHTVSSDLSTDIKKWLTFGAKVKYTYGYEDHPSGGMTESGLGAYTGVLKTDLPPYMPVRHPDGSYAGQGDITNPMAIGELAGWDRRKVNDLWVTGKITLRPLEDWNINADFTFNPYSRNIERVIKPFYEKRADGTEYIYPWVRNHGVTRQNDNDYYTAVNVYTDYTRSFARNNFKLTLGYNQEVKTNKSFSAGRLGLINMDVPLMSLATGTQTVSDNATSWAVQGVFGRLHYDYDERYLVDINARYDGSSKFAKGHRFALYPSIAAAWYLSKEEFMEGTKSVLSDFKLRASYGSLGNQAINNNFAYVPGYGVGLEQGYLIGGSRGTVVGAPGLVSASLTWETVTSWNVGVDFGFLNNRLSGSFDFFNRYTKNMLTASQPLPGVLGAGEPQSNAADLKTMGWEFILRWNDRIESAGLEYYASFNISDAVAEITKYRNPTGTLSSYYVGRRIGEIWGYQSNGLFQTVEEIAAAPSQSRLYNGTWNPGDVRYEDTNNDGEVSSGANTLDDHGDISIIGNTTARYQYGFTLGASWKGIDLEMFFQGVGKRNWVPDGRYFGINGRWDVPPRDMLSYWSPSEKENPWGKNTPDGFLPRVYQSGRGNKQTNTRYLQNAAYLRLKQLSVGYTLPSAWTQKLTIDKVRVYFTGQNLFTWTKLSKLYDPEIIGSAARDTGVASNMSYPVAKTFSFGLNLTF